MAARRNKPATSRPPGAAIITLTTDFGTRDPFVGIMKGVILGLAPSARIVDLTHAIPPQNLVAGAHALASAARWFPPGTIHVAVVDPGVGTRRRALLIETADAFYVGPDNGVLSLAVPSRGIRRIVDVSHSAYRLRPMSRTFHGRDVFAPIAAAVAAGVPPTRLGRTVRSLTRIAVPRMRRRSGRLLGEVIWADGFGNLTSNIGRDALTAADFRGRRLSITIAGHVVPFRASYADVPAGRAVALVNSSNLLEIAVSHGSAADVLGVGPGSEIVVEAV
jgi:S-adenosyl-L-methionine hydrolase (adenosine-forming)